MTAVLAAVARFALGAALVLACAAAALWAALGPPGPWTMARTAVMCAVVAGAVWTWERLGNRHRLPHERNDNP